MDFWSIFSRVDCFPNCGCEPMMDGCWICQPVAMLSSVPYLLVAVGLLIHHRKQPWNNKLFAWCVMLGIVGVSSMLAHSTYFRGAMALDYTSIIFLQTFFFFVRVMELGPLKKISHKITFPGYYFFLFLVLLPLDVWSQFYVALVMFTIAMVDFIYHKGISVLWERNLFLSFVFMGVGLIFMMIDKHETFCAMKYVPYGHTLWHFGSALGAYYFGWWYFFEHEPKTKFT